MSYFISPEEGISMLNKQTRYRWDYLCRHEVHRNMCVAAIRPESECIPVFSTPAAGSEYFYTPKNEYEYLLDDFAKYVDGLDYIPSFKYDLDVTPKLTIVFFQQVLVFYIKLSAQFSSLEMSY